MHVILRNTFTELVKVSLFFFIVATFSIFTSLASADVNAESWMSDSAYFDTREKHFRVFYSRLNINTTRVVHAFGKDAYNLIIKFDDITFDAAEGFGKGGPKMAAINIIKSQGIEAAMLFLNMYLDTPQQLSRELANKAMKDGIRAMNENYRLYKYGLDDLSSVEKKLFRKNQIKVDLLGAAKKLYNAAGEDRESFTKNDAILNSVAKLEDMLLATKIPGRAISVSKAMAIFDRANLPLKSYKPFVYYTHSIDIAHALNYDSKKQKRKITIGKSNTKGINKAFENDENPTSISLAQCVGGSIRKCSKYCYQTCDHNGDGKIGGAREESICYSSCNRSCDLECVPKVSRNTEKKVDSWPKALTVLEGKRFRTVLVLFKPEGTGNFDDIGLRILGPGGSILTCSSLGKKSTFFGKCLQRRLLFPDTEKVVVEEFGVRNMKPGNYTFDFYVPVNSESQSVEILNDSMIVVPTKKNGGVLIEPGGIIISAGTIKDLIHLTVN